MNENMYDISSKKRVTKNFLEVSHGSRAKQRQRNVQKKCAARTKLFFLLIRPIVFLPLSGVAFAAQHYAILYFLYKQTLNIIEILAFSPG